MAEYLIQDTTLTAIADSIREKTETTGAISVNDMATMINGISQIITSTTEITEGSSSSYPEGSLYVIYEEA